MAFVRVRDVNIHYEERGKGFPLVLAYGLGGNTGMWAGQFEAFAERYRLIVWDPRGHGLSDSPPQREQYGLAVSAQDLLALLDHLGIQRAYVGGLSMGGGIAARFAMSHPSLVAALLLMDSASASGSPISDSMRAMRQKTIELAETRGMAAVAEYAIASNPNLKSQAEASPAARERLRRMFLALDPTGYAHTIRAMIDETFPADQLSRLSMPTLLLVGEQDPALKAVRLTHGMIPGSKLVVLPNAGHLSNLDSPDEFNAAVVSFLRSLET